MDIKEILKEIDSQRFNFGDWETDLSSVMRGGSYDDGCICEYIRKLEELAEAIKEAHPCYVDDEED